jgi:hypothetical protein
MGNNTARELTSDEIKNIVIECIDNNQHPAGKLPNFGIRSYISLEDAINFLLEDKYEELSNSADMVIVSLVNDEERLAKIGCDNLVSDYNPGDINATSLGNFAYLAVFSNTKYKKIASDQLKKIKNINLLKNV